MQEKKTYTKLSDLVNKEFKVLKAYGYQWKMWDNNAKRMLVSEKYEQGYRKVYGLETDKGVLDVGSGQLSALLEAVYSKGEANINGRTFTVKSNGKTGMDIRYFFNAVRESQPVGDGYEKFRQQKELLQGKVEDNLPEDDDIELGEKIDLSDIPF